MAMLGKSEELNTPTAEVFEAQEYPTSNGQIGNSRAFNQRSRDSVVLRSGWMTELEKRVFKDLLLRNEAWIMDGANLRKVTFSSASWSPRADDNYLHAVELTATYAWDEVAYGR